MVILIDTPKGGWSHLVSDDINYLHDFARQIGIKKCWFQNKRGKNQPHYDVKESKFKDAINQGATLVSSKEIVEFLKLNYKK